MGSLPLIGVFTRLATGILARERERVRERRDGGRERLFETTQNRAEREFILDQ